VVTDRKLVSVVTGTWRRHDLLMECIQNVREQTYRPLEHVIVSDGPDPELEDLLLDATDGLESEVHDDVRVRFVQLGKHWSGILTNSISAAPFMVAQFLARGEYQMWLADDERMLVPDHIEKLVGLIEEYDLDFAYPLVDCWQKDHPNNHMVIGTNPPRNGTITHALYRADALDKGMLFRTHVGSGTDWDAIARCMAAGGRWGLLNEVTLSHRIDK